MKKKVLITVLLACLAFVGVSSSIGCGGGAPDPEMKKSFDR